MVKTWASREIFFQGDKVGEPITSLETLRANFVSNIYSVKNMIIWGVHCQGFSPTLSLKLKLACILVGSFLVIR